MLDALALAAVLDGEPAWPGVDETVVAKVAAEAGRAPRKPFIEGDLLLFTFLMAGIAGGFALGYAYRGLFIERARDA
jgi:hypothetical protein